jgi:hypothetical protein
VTLRARWVTLRARWVTLRARCVTLRARWVTLRARWVTLRARCVTLRARWVTQGAPEDEFAELVGSLQTAVDQSTLTSRVRRREAMLARDGPRPALLDSAEPLEPAAADGQVKRVERVLLSPSTRPFHTVSDTNSHR